MATWKQQALIEAPVEEVWELISDPSRYPEWGGETIEITGLPTQIEKGSTFRQKAPTVLGFSSTTTFEVEELDDLREIKLRCQTSGYYSHWLLTEVRGNTFADVEMGVEPAGRGLTAKAIGVAHTKGYLRRQAEQAFDGLRRVLTRGRR
jgi:uncharacterized protein YndB with AHSA1/START domain